MSMTPAAELANIARNAADTANDHAGESLCETYPATMAQVAIAYAVLAAVEHLELISEQLAAVVQVLERGE